MQRELSSWGLAAFAARYVLASRRVLLPSRPLLVLPSWDVATDGNAWPGSLLVHLRAHGPNPSPAVAAALKRALPRCPCNATGPVATGTGRALTPPLNLFLARITSRLSPLP